MTRTLHKIAEDALEEAFATAKCNKRGRGLVVKKGSKDKETSFKFKLYECTFEAFINDDSVTYCIYPRRVNLSDKWFASLYVWFDKVPATEHSKFRNTMVADFRALFVSIFNTPFAWEGADWESGKTPFFLTDSFWLNEHQTAPVALEYPNQTINNGVIPLRSLLKLQDGYNHVIGYKPSESAGNLMFQTFHSRTGGIKLMDDITIYD